MKRWNNLFEQITSLENLQLADQKAAKGKAFQKGVQEHFRNRDTNLYNLRETLLAGNFITSAYSTFTIYDPKEREISSLPFYPDRIVHHAVMNVLEPLFVSFFTKDTYSCIKERGIHTAANAVKKALTDCDNTTYCLKLDIKKFYPSVDNTTLKQLLKRKIKDQQLISLLDSIIDSAPGLPIGNYLSQYFANFYLTYFDHYVKENLGVKYYFRYADDMVILSRSKVFLHKILAEITKYLDQELKLVVKENYQIFPVTVRGIDFVGYKFFPTHTLLRKSIKKRFAHAVARKAGQPVIAAYMGWAKHCNSRNLIKKLKIA
ncbi:MAG: reverse transcriptase/maturase family protein [Chitinophagia bacterium]